MAQLNWSDDAWDYYQKLLAIKDEAIDAIDDALDLIEDNASRVRRRAISTDDSLKWLVDVHHRSGRFHIAWCKDVEPGWNLIVYLGPALARWS